MANSLPSLKGIPVCVCARVSACVLFMLSCLSLGVPRGQSSCTLCSDQPGQRPLGWVWGSSLHSTLGHTILICLMKVRGWMLELLQASVSMLAEMCKFCVSSVSNATCHFADVAQLFALLLRHFNDCSHRIYVSRIIMQGPLKIMLIFAFEI